MPKHSAGILLYRKRQGKTEVLLVHPGGPFWARKDVHAWSVPKGEFAEGEDPEDAARREFFEETGHPMKLPLRPLPQVRTSGKIIHVFAGEGDFDPDIIKSNHFELAWPPASGKMHSFPEVDKAAWFDLTVSREKIHKGQIALIEMLEDLLSQTQDSEDA